MVGLFEAIRDTALSIYCTAAAPVATGLAILGNVYEGLGGEEQGEDLRDAAQLYRSAQQVACNRPPDDIGPAVNPGFSGGQCVGDIYEVDTSRNGGPPSTQTMTNQGQPIQGPISGIEQFDNGTGLFNYRLIVGNGFTNLATNFTTPQNFTIVAIRNLTNPSDPCGNPGPEIPQYDPTDWTSTPTINYDDDGGNPMTVSPTVVFSPNFLGPDGGLRVPFDFEFAPGVNLTGDINLNTGDITLGGGGNGNGPDYSDPQEEEQPSGGPGELGDVIGVRVVSTEDGSGVDTTEILQTGGNPNIYVPRTATVAFRYQTGVNTSAWGTDIPVKNLNFVVWAERPALEVRVTPESGWMLDVRRILEKRTGECG